MSIPRMNYPQYRKARKLVRECCNYDCGNCLLLDDGEECVCVQSISYSLLCRWFRAAVLPLDTALCSRTGTGRNETLLRVRGRVHAEVQPGEVLPGLRQTAASPQGGGTAAEKVPAVYAFGALKIPENQGDSEAVGGVAE